MTDPHLTPAELEVLALICDGKTVNEIAMITGRAYETVRAHKTIIMSKFEVYKDTALVAAALRRGVID
ncbi:response regulator transcription factor [Rhizobium sp. 21-4511-3d]